jgi:ribonuclease BN (tRNA processing enzyme)
MKHLPRIFGLLSATFLLGSALLISPILEGAQPERMTDGAMLLGTRGGPRESATHRGIASIVGVGDRYYMIDAGAGADIQLAAAGIPVSAIKEIFLTHLHDDHTIGLPAVLTFVYEPTNIELVGPPRTTALRDAIVSLRAFNAEIRGAESGQSSLSKKGGLQLSARDVVPGVVYKDDKVQVTAAENCHFHLDHTQLAGRNRSYSYRFDLPTRSIMFTGDTGTCDTLAELAKNADVLVSEMATSRDVARVPAEIRSHMLQEHLSPAQVGQLAAKANVKMVVLAHIWDVGEEDVAEIKKYYSGKVVVGSDLLVF